MSQEQGQTSSDSTAVAVGSSSPVKVERACRMMEGQYCDDGYAFIGAAQSAGWHAVAGWGLDGWDLGDWPYVVYVFRGDLERAWYCEGDITLETFASSEARERATDTDALFYWREEPWTEGVDLTDPPAHLRGPFSWKRLDAEKPRVAEEVS